MQPQQTTPPNPVGNYDFIMNPSSPPKRSSLGGGGNSMAMRLLVVLGGLFLLAMIAFVFMRFIGVGGADYDKAGMLSVAQDQTELIRLAERGTEDGISQSTKNFAITAKLGIKSEQNKLFEYLATQGYTPDPKALLLKQSAQTDAQLDEAKSSSTFDTAFAGVMEQSLQTYKNDLTSAYNNSKGKNAKAALQERYKVADMLLNQLTGEALN